MADSTHALKMEERADEKTEVGSEPVVVGVAESEGGSNTKGVMNTVAEETGDTFKKPALFIAPSVFSRKGVAAVPGGSRVTEASKEVCQPKGELRDNKEAGSSAPSTIENFGVPSEKVTETDENGAPTKAPQKIKPRFPAKPPPDGKLNAAPPLPYTEPPWGGLAESAYSFEILKNGTILDTLPLAERSFFVFGRLPVCDVSLEHPSISRYHAVVQYRRRPGEPGVVGEEAGFYAFDLGSTHGTFINKNKIPPKTYIRLRVGHVLKFGGSSRLFILQGPDSDEEAESELTVTELREQGRKQRAELERRMMGDGSDDDEEEEEEEEKKKEEGERESSTRTTSSKVDSGCSWGMEEDVLPEEDENEENPFATEFQEDQEAAYLKDPKKALQGFYDREGEELEYEYEDKGHGTWTCRIKLPVDDALGRQLVAEVTHSGKKKEAAVQCSLEACRMLEARGLLRQEAVSRKRKKKNWEEEDFYDSDDDTFLDRTGMVERKRKERMKKAGKIAERPDTYDSLVEKLAEVEKELAETEKKLSSSAKGGVQRSAEDPLDAFMSGVNAPSPLDSIERRKMHVRVAELRREAQRLRRLQELTRPAQLPPLQAGSSCSPGGHGAKQAEGKKPALPMFGAMKGGSKFRLRTGTIGKMPPKRATLPAELFVTKELPPGGEEEDDEEEEEVENEQADPSGGRDGADTEIEGSSSVAPEPQSHIGTGKSGPKRPKPVEEPTPNRGEEEDGRPPECSDKKDEVKRKRKVYGASKPSVTLSTQYPKDDPDYCVWMPPAGQSGDGRTHLNDKYGY
ncbi:kanadaptin isoform X2 [Brienomyrus brachyistius]|uniref:kanadaptin isoform X2 n=1 Tax=Brienomyrus brachyistius TaxID=42636 RepID=UPI0020B251A1|nr:kanadaptin isoform X2 [Brienomyrus brachyistius]